MDKFPSAQKIIEEAKRIKPKAGINQLHALTFDLMIKYRHVYYKNKVENFLNRPDIAILSNEIKSKIGRELLKPVKGGYKVYSNFMEETSRRISQVFQVISGNIAELCIEKELIDTGLRPKINYGKKKEHTDLIIYYPKFPNYLKKHRIEVKNVSLRERGTRGFKFDGDSMFGFFNDPSEFTETNIKIVEEQCRKTGGYCYVPPTLLEKIKNKVRSKKFKSNEEFISDMKKFVEKGII